MDELNLYDDLDEFQEEHEKKTKELQDLEDKLQQSFKTIEELNNENKSLKKIIQRIKLGFQSLLDTARSEIKRKDKEIVRLNKEKDDICFRRKIHIKPSNSNDKSQLQHGTFINPFRQNDNEILIDTATTPTINPGRVEKSEPSKRYRYKDAECDNANDFKWHRSASGLQDEKYKHNSHEHDKNRLKIKDDGGARSHCRENAIEKVDKRYCPDHKDCDEHISRNAYERPSKSPKLARYSKSSDKGWSRERAKKYQNAQRNLHRGRKNTETFSKSPRKNKSHIYSNRANCQNDKIFGKIETEKCEKTFNKDLRKEKSNHIKGENLHQKQTKLITTHNSETENGNKAKHDKENAEIFNVNITNKKSEHERAEKKSCVLTNKSDKDLDKESGNSIQVDMSIFNSNQFSMPETNKLCTPRKVALFNEIFGKSPIESSTSSTRSNSLFNDTKGILSKTSEIEVISSATTSPGDYTDINSSMPTPISREIISSSRNTLDFINADTNQATVRSLKNIYGDGDEIDKCFIPTQNVEQNADAIVCVDLTKFVDDDIANELEFIQIPGLDLCSQWKETTAKHNTNTSIEIQVNFERKDKETVKESTKTETEYSALNNETTAIASNTNNTKIKEIEDIQDCGIVNEKRVSLASEDFLKVIEINRKKELPEKINEENKTEFNKSERLVKNKPLNSKEKKNTASLMQNPKIKESINSEKFELQVKDSNCRSVLTEATPQIQESTVSKIIPIGKVLSSESVQLAQKVKDISENITDKVVVIEPLNSGGLVPLKNPYSTTYDNLIGKQQSAVLPVKEIFHKDGKSMDTKPNVEEDVVELEHLKTTELTNVVQSEKECIFSYSKDLREPRAIEVLQSKGQNFTFLEQNASHLSSGDKTSGAFQVIGTEETALKTTDKDLSESMIFNKGKLDRVNSHVKEGFQGENIFVEENMCKTVEMVEMLSQTKEGQGILSKLSEQSPKNEHAIKESGSQERNSWNQEQLNSSKETIELSSPRKVDIDMDNHFSTTEQKMLFNLSEKTHEKDHLVEASEQDAVVLEKITVNSEFRQTKREIDSIIQDSYSKEQTEVPHNRKAILNSCNSASKTESNVVETSFTTSIKESHNDRSLLTLCDPLAFEANKGLISAFKDGRSPLLNSCYSPTPEAVIDDIVIHSNDETSVIDSAVNKDLTTTKVRVVKNSDAVNPDLEEKSATKKANEQAIFNITKFTETESHILESFHDASVTEDSPDSTKIHVEPSNFAITLESNKDVDTAAVEMKVIKQNGESSVKLGKIDDHEQKEDVNENSVKSSGNINKSVDYLVDKEENIQEVRDNIIESHLEHSPAILKNIIEHSYQEVLSPSSETKNANSVESESINQTTNSICTFKAIAEVNDFSKEISESITLQSEALKDKTKNCENQFDIVLKPIRNLSSEEVKQTEKELEKSSLQESTTYFENKRELQVEPKIPKTGGKNSSEYFVQLTEQTNTNTPQKIITNLEGFAEVANDFENKCETQTDVIKELTEKEFQLIRDESNKSDTILNQSEDIIQNVGSADAESTNLVENENHGQCKEIVRLKETMDRIKVINSKESLCVGKPKYITDGSPSDHLVGEKESKSNTLNNNCISSTYEIQTSPPGVNTDHTSLTKDLNKYFAQEQAKHFPDSIKSVFVTKTIKEINMEGEIIEVVKNIFDINETLNINENVDVPEQGTESSSKIQCSLNKEDKQVTSSFNTSAESYDYKNLQSKAGISIFEFADNKETPLTETKTTNQKIKSLLNEEVQYQTTQRQQSTSFALEVKTKPAVEDVIPKISPTLSDTYNSSPLLPSISTTSPTPSNFSGIFSKQSSSTVTIEDEVNKSKKKSPHFIAKPKEYILPAASVLCNADNLENATKSTKKLHWELLDNNEMTEIEDDDDIDTTDNEQINIREEPLENASTFPKQPSLQKNLTLHQPQKCSPSETDTQTENESLLRDLRQQTVKYKKLHHSKIHKIKQCKHKLPTNVKARLRATGMPNVTTSIEKDLLKQEPPLPIVLPKRPVGRPRKVQNAARKSTKEIILSHKQKKTMENYNSQHESQAEVHSLNVKDEIFTKTMRTNSNSEENKTDLLDGRGRNIPEIINMEKSVKYLSTFVEKLEISGEPCSSRDANKVSKYFENQMASNKNEDPHNISMIYHKQVSSKDDINICTTEKSTDECSKQAEEKDHCDFNILKNTSIDKNNVLPNSHIKGQEVMSSIKETQDINILNIINCDKAYVLLDKIDRFIVKDKVIDNVIPPMTDTLHEVSTKNRETLISKSGRGADKISSVKKKISKRNSLKGKSPAKPLFKTKCTSKPIENKVTKLISLHDFGIQVRPPKLHLSSFRIPKIKKYPENVVENSWKLESIVELKNEGHKELLIQSTEHQKKGATILQENEHSEENHKTVNNEKVSNQGNKSQVKETVSDQRLSRTHEPIKFQQKSSSHYTNHVTKSDSYETSSSNNTSNPRKKAINIHRRILDSSCDEDNDDDNKANGETPSNFENVRQKSKIFCGKSIETEENKATDDSKLPADQQSDNSKLTEIIKKNSDNQEPINTIKSYKMREKSMYVESTSLMTMNMPSSDLEKVIKKSCSRSNLQECSKNIKSQDLGTETNKDGNKNIETHPLILNKNFKVISNQPKPITSFKMGRKSMHIEKNSLHNEGNKTNTTELKKSKHLLDKNPEDIVLDKSGTQLNSIKTRRISTNLCAASILNSNIIDKESLNFQDLKNEKKNEHEFNTDNRQKMHIGNYNSSVILEQQHHTTMGKKSTKQKPNLEINKDDGNSLKYQDHKSSAELYKSKLAGERKTKELTFENISEQKSAPCFDSSVAMAKHPSITLGSRRSKRNLENNETFEISVGNLNKCSEELKRKPDDASIKIDNFNPKDASFSSYVETTKEETIDVGRMSANQHATCRVENVNAMNTFKVDVSKQDLKYLPEEITHNADVRHQMNSSSHSSVVLTQSVDSNRGLKNQDNKNLSEVKQKQENKSADAIDTNLNLKADSDSKRNSSNQPQNLEFIRVSTNSLNQGPEKNASEQKSRKQKSLKKPVDSNLVEIGSSPHMEADSGSSVILAQTKSIKIRRKSTNLRKILDSSSEDNEPLIKKPTVITSEVKTPVAKPKQRRKRVVKVLSISVESPTDIINTSQQSSSQPSPLTSPILNHPIFNTEVPTQSESEFAACLPMTPNLQDDTKFKEIDSKLHELFQSPQYTGDCKIPPAVSAPLLTIFPPPLNDSQSNMTINETLDLNGINNQSSSNIVQVNESTISLNDTTAMHNNNEIKHLSLGSAEYRFEKVSDNVINLFISRKRKRKHNN